MILALSTSGTTTSVGLGLDDGGTDVATLDAPRTRGRDLLPQIAALLERHAARPADIGHVVVDIGPGSFTGVRVGVTAAKSLAWAIGLATVEAVPSLELLAWSAPSEDTVLAVRDAGRGSVYSALWGPVGGEPWDRPVLAPMARRAAAAVGVLAREARIVGEEATALGATFGWTGPSLDIATAAEQLIALSVSRAGNEAASHCPVHQLQPMYLQDSAAQRRRAEGGQAEGRGAQERHVGEEA